MNIQNNRRKRRAQRVTISKILVPSQATKVKNQAPRRVRVVNANPLPIRKNGSTQVTVMSHPNNTQPPAVSSKRTYLSKALTHTDTLSEADWGFLKCAFAAPDFANTAVKGIPDNYNGMSLVKKHKSVGSVSLTANQDLYLLLFPIPGIAYASATVAAGTPILSTTTFTCVNYSDFTSLFGSTGNTAADIVTKFRFVSNHMEIVPTANQMTWTGNIQSFTIPVAVSSDDVEVTAASATTGVMRRAITGLQALNSTNSNQYTAPFNLGCFAGAYNRNSVFDFNPILEGVSQIPQKASGPLPGGAFGIVTAPNNIPGFDNNMDSLVIKISGVTAAESFILKTWACVEYQAIPGSSVYEYMDLSPHYNERVLRLYREIINALPVAVTFIDNENFWARVLNIIRRVSGPLSYMPGPYGLMASGVNAAATGLRQLIL
jgi:hypothetical protein